MDVVQTCAARAESLGRSTLRALTSKTAQRTLLNTVLITVASVVLYGFAVLGYLLFYHNYLPDQVTTVPVHLQYGYGTHPYGIASLHPPYTSSSGRMKDLQAYDISVSLTLPRSPPNLERGNFMLALHLLYPTIPQRPGMDVQKILSEGWDVLYTSTRPAIMPYTDPMVSTASRVLFLGYHILFPHSETETLVVPMAERLTFPRGGKLPGSLVLEVQAGQNLQVYKTEVTLTAQLSGLRWVMYNHWLASFMVFTGAFWGLEVVFMAAAWGALMLVLGGVGGGEGSGDKVGIKGGEKGTGRRIIKGEEEMSDTERTFPSTSKQPPLRYEGRVKTEEGVEGTTALAEVPAVGAEADDEDDEIATEGFRDSGIGTSGYSDHLSREGARRRLSGRRPS
ncbi:putative adipose-regulatory protein-domain-containing protein [Diplogelasinospora grovesii]|uniref:Adipose-regulatory protein-domain-containing protein n=1 Tax=Diplogelasinospora grovesii TaxID=303347 RepID=A0AAN6NGY5_9PEZI|nr:putative adipose-regulatory protein-domain-containing protein [Diplogelasinospora grovesii]